MIPDPHALITEAKARREYEAKLDTALNMAQCAIDEFYNGDRAWAAKWLLTAWEANEAKKLAVYGREDVNPN